MKTSCSMVAGKESGNSKQELELSLPVSFHCHPWLNRALKLSSSNVFDIKCPPESPFSNCFMWAYGSEGDTDMESWLCQGPYFSRATQVCWNSSSLTRYHQSFEQQGVPESAERKQNVYKDSTPAEESVTSPGFTYTDATLVPTIPTGFSDGLVPTFWRIFRSTLIQGDSIVSTQSQAQEVVN